MKRRSFLSLLGLAAPAAVLVKPSAPMAEGVVHFVPTPGNTGPATIQFNDDGYKIIKGYRRASIEELKGCHLLNGKLHYD